MRRGLTLTELIIASSLVGLIGLAVVSADMTARRMLYISDRVSEVTNEVAIAMQHITKNLKLAIGSTEIGSVGRGVNLLPAGCTTDCTRLEIRQDGDGDSIADDTFNYVYVFVSENNKINFCSNGCASPTEAIATKITNATFSDGGGSSNPWIEVRITARYNPTELNSSENPEVTLASRVFLNSVSAR